ncbi:MAG: hypothetical protein FIB01_02655 [Gemmatimonadetes bacterium]|nr:hypothetical protein [Gemmatimonadota bacterium]
MRIRWWSGMALAASLVAGRVEAQKLEVESGPVKLGITGRVQFQFNGTSVSGEEAGLAVAPAGTSFETRRIRLAAELTIDGWIRGMIEPDFAMARLQLRQVWMELGFSDALALRAGQWKKPFSLIQVTSSSMIPMIERNVRIRGLAEALKKENVAGTLTSFGSIPLIGEEQYLLENLGYDSYDMGAALRGKLGRVGYEVGVFNGTGWDKTDENAGKSFTGRVTWTAPVAAPLRLGLGASRRDYLRTVSGVSITQNGTALEADVEYGAYRRPGLWLLAEVTGGDNLVAGNFRGAHAVGAWYFPTGQERIEGIEPVLRLSWADPNTGKDNDAGVLLTPGVNLHFYGRNQLMFNWDFYLPQGDVFSSQNALRAQANLYF